MRETQDGNTITVEYQSIHEFISYIKNAKPNETFKNSFDRRSEVEDAERTRFTGTQSMQEALDIFSNGWDNGTEKLSHIFREKVRANDIQKVRRNVVGVQGYQAIVPLYLMGQPESMVSSVLKPMKQKVVTIDKDISYHGGISSDDIFEYSANALRIVHSLEGQGIRCNINVILGTEASGKKYIVKVRIKSANERFNIHKMSFPLAHTSMLRRFYFKWIETYPGIPIGYKHGYGHPSSDETLRRAFKDDYIIPRVLSSYKIEKVKKIEDLKEYKYDK